MAGNQQLLYTMELCGHFLFHRRGGKRGQVKVLRILSERGELPQKEVQGILNIQSGSMSELVGKMEKNGLIERKRDDRDKRHYNLKITEKGMEETVRLKKQSAEQEEVIFEALSGKEQKELERMLNVLLDDWRAHYDESLFHHRQPDYVRQSNTMGKVDSADNVQAGKE
ncbi:MAG: MarR family winged helix-turn-helix transcriptional regulator [Thermoflexaceae bacterium]|nr:MarR family winged helix-turn-helix transcriptional regulator [Thermoflexaceae bacterium]